MFFWRNILCVYKSFFFSFKLAAWQSFHIFLSQRISLWVFPLRLHGRKNKRLWSFSIIYMKNSFRVTAKASTIHSNEKNANNPEEHIYRKCLFRTKRNYSSVKLGKQEKSISLWIRIMWISRYMWDWKNVLCMPYDEWQTALQATICLRGAGEHLKV